VPFHLQSAKAWSAPHGALLPTAGFDSKISGSPWHSWGGSVWKHCGNKSFTKSIKYHKVHKMI
jgi:hypothetical protein